eukprot:8294480-Alexandrium_andersonii.AAC.1
MVAQRASSGSIAWRPSLRKERVSESSPVAGRTSHGWAPEPLAARPAIRNSERTARGVRSRGM